MNERFYPDINQCQFCDSGLTGATNEAGQHFVMCCCCFARGPAAATDDKAIADWNNSKQLRRLRSKNRAKAETIRALIKELESVKADREFFRKELESSARNRGVQF